MSNGGVHGEITSCPPRGELELEMRGSLLWVTQFLSLLQVLEV